MQILHQYPCAKKIINKNIWSSESFYKKTSWKFTVSNKLINELSNICDKIPVTENFLEKYEHNLLCIPEIIKLATEIKNEIIHGTGVAYITGLSNYPFTRTEQKLFYLALGKAMGHVFEHYGRLYDVTDHGFDYTKDAVPVSKTNSETSFHTDSSSRYVNPDFLGLLCLQPGQSGGESMFSSATAVHEMMRHYHLDLLELLYKEYIRDIVTPGQEKNKNSLLQNRFPIFHYNINEKKLTFRYMRYWIEQGHKHADLSLDPKHIHALNTLDKLLASDKLHVRFTLNSGDIIFCNNHTIVHNRTQYTDDPDNPRLLVRLWGGLA